MEVLDRIVGIYHFLGDKAPKNVPEVPPRPRRPNPWRQEGRIIVARASASPDIKESVSRVLALLGPPPPVNRGEQVLVKPNFNSAAAYPGSTDLGFLKAVVELLLELGARVTIGESSGGVWRPTHNTFQKLDLYRLADSLGVELIAFDDRRDDWVRVRINGSYFETLTMPRSAYEADRLIYLPCMKTHRLAGFSGALKLAFGFVHPGERRSFHLGHLQEKLADVSLCWQPDLVIMDGRKALVTGGPEGGTLVEPGILLASGDPIAIDIEAIQTLLHYRARNRLTPDPWQMPQIAAALRHGLGPGKDDYVVKT